MKKLFLATIVLFNFLVAFSQENINYTSGLNYMLDKKYNEAVKKFTEAIKIEPDNSLIYNYRGLAYLSLRDYTSSMNDFNRAIEIDPTESDPYCNRGYLKMSLGDFEGAILDFNLVILKSEKTFSKFGFYLSSHKKAISNRAMSKLKLNDFVGAFNDAVENINLYPSESSGYYIKGVCEINSGDLNSGCKNLSKAGELGESEAFALIKTYCK